jgi:hypothetical protein
MKILFLSGYGIDIRVDCGRLVFGKRRNIDNGVSRNSAKIKKPR